MDGGVAVNGSPLRFSWGTRAKLQIGPDAFPQVLAGGLVGLALSVVLHSGAVALVILSATGALASLLARGVSAMVLSLVAALGISAAVLQVVVIVVPDSRVPVWVVVGPALGLVFGVTSALVGRSRALPRQTGGADVATAAISLVIAVVYARHFHALGAFGRLPYVLRVGDSAAWAHEIAVLGHGHSEVTTYALDPYGTVMGVLLAAVSCAVPLSGRNGIGAADGVVGTFGIVVVCAPLVAATATVYIAPKASGIARALAIFAGGAVLIEFGLLSMSLGFLSTAVAGFCTLLGLAALTWTFAGETTDVIPVFVIVGILYAAGASWFPLIPLAIVAILASTAFRIRGRRRESGATRAARDVSASIGPAVAAILLVEQLHSVLGTSGTAGGSALLQASGVAPKPSTVLTIVPFVVLAVVAWRLPWRGRPSSALKRMGAVLMLVLYSAAVYDADAFVSGNGHYGSEKLLYVVVHLVAAVSVSLVLSTTWVPRHETLAVVASFIAIVLATVMEHGSQHDWLRNLDNTGAGDSEYWWRAVTQGVPTQYAFCVDPTSPNVQGQPQAAGGCDRWVEAAYAVSPSATEFIHGWARVSSSGATFDLGIDLIKSMPSGTTAIVVYTQQPGPGNGAPGWLQQILATGRVVPYSPS